MDASLSFPVSGVAADYRVPGSIAEVLFAQGPSTASAGERTVLFVGPMFSSGATYTANTVYPVKNEAEVSAGAGAGSPLHRMVRAFLLKNNTARIWVLPYAETSGGSPVAAAGSITVSGTASAAGAVEIDVCGEPIVVSYASGEAAATTGAKIVAAINAKTWLPVTASGTATVALTAKLKGASQGTASVGVIHFRATPLSGAGLTFAVSGGALGLGTGTAGADGSTTEVANMTTALTSALSSRYYYVVFSNSVALSLAAMGAHLIAKALPKNGLRQVAITGYTGSLATGITLATGVNYERIDIAWQYNSEHDNAELAGYLAAARHWGESQSYRYNFDGFRGSMLGIQAAFSAADWPTVDDQNDAINGGLTPIASDARGAYVVMSCSTRSKATGGSVADFRATETHRVSVCDAVADTICARTWASFGGQAIRADQLLSNGTPNPNQDLPKGVTTPSRIAPTVAAVIDEFYALGCLDEVEKTKAGLQVIKSPVNTGRAEAQMDLRVIDLLHQMTWRIAEVTPG